MKRTLVAIIVVLFLNTGCGTVITRCGKTPFGIYPYKSVATVGKVYFDNTQWDEKLGATIDLPFDFAFDTLFLLPDLVLGSCGYEKDGIGAWIH